jgi:hypothetical protein
MGNTKGENMINFIIYVVIGMIASWLFKLIAGVLELIMIFPFFGRSDEAFERSFQHKPKSFLTVLISKNIIIGLANATMIFMITANFLQMRGGNLWLYIVLSIIWSLFIISFNGAFRGIYFFTSTVTLSLYWLSFGSLAWIIVGFLTFVISVSYYFGKVKVIREQGLINDYI